MKSITDNAYHLQALQQLQHYHQFVTYIFVSRGSSITKPPINAHAPQHLPIKERYASVDKPDTWSSYEKALSCYTSSSIYKGIGFVFAESDPFTGIDLDHCRNPQTGSIAPWAKHIITSLNSYTELSPSGTGVHIIIRADLVATADAIGRTEIHHKKNALEIYSTDRYFTITEKHLQGTPKIIEDRQEELNNLYFETFCMDGEEEKHEEGRTVQQHATPLSSAVEQPLLEDAALITLASQAQGGRGLRFQRLWQGDASEYRTSSGEIDESRADQALLGTLAYWTQKDPYRMERLFKQSGLYGGRPDRQRKWDARARSGETYGEGSIRMAITTCTSTYNPGWRPTGWLPYEEYKARQGAHRSSLERTTNRQRSPQPSFPHVLSSATARQAHEGGLAQ